MNSTFHRPGLFLGLFCLLLVAAASAVPITGPITIDTPGYYDLSGDLTSNQSPFITITTNNVYLEGNGFGISAEPGTTGDAVIVLPPEGSALANITIRDLSLNGWDVGLHAVHGVSGVIRNVSSADAAKNGFWLENSSGLSISGCEVSGSGLPGIAIDNSSGNMISWNRVTGSSDVGIYLVYSQGNRVLYNELDNNRYNGIFLENSTNNHLSQNSAADNAYPGIALSTSDKNLISRNYLTNNQVAQVYVNNATRNTVIGNFGRGRAPMTVKTGDPGYNQIRYNIWKP
jgi:parallel beta-helix repeat protein